MRISADRTGVVPLRLVHVGDLLRASVAEIALGQALSKERRSGRWGSAKYIAGAVTLDTSVPIFRSKLPDPWCILVITDERGSVGTIEHEGVAFAPTLPLFEPTTLRVAKMTPGQGRGARPTWTFATLEWSGIAPPRAADTEPSSERRCTFERIDGGDE
jgi:hypothetical protein